MDEELTCSNISPSGLISSTSTGTNEKKKKKNEQFPYGNFSRYYGFRNEGLDHDPRLDLLPKEWFNKKRILDVGCNAGHLTLEIAKQFNPSWILGIDIDDHLVGVARKNIRHYFGEGHELIGKFPSSIKDYNVWFYRENYVLEIDEYLEKVQPEFDVVLALSITKWVHLNWGDEGIKRFFRRIWKHLNQGLLLFFNLRIGYGLGGRLLLELQDWSKYYKSARASPKLFETYRDLKFKPDQFKNYLVNFLGFVECQELGIPEGVTKGFKRSILVFQKVNLNTRKRKLSDDKKIESLCPMKRLITDYGKENVNAQIITLLIFLNKTQEIEAKAVKFIPASEKITLTLETRPGTRVADHTVRRVELTAEFERLLVGVDYPPTCQGYINEAVFYIRAGKGATASDKCWHAAQLQIRNFMIGFNLYFFSHSAANKIVWWMRFNCFGKNKTGKRRSEEIKTLWSNLNIYLYVETLTYKS
ncbi:Bin3-type SAM domain-containing protein [Meloidogyne graminicola]|uniref:RNA methyltransferase n=1 Tax=Meloidogyne graminicola TaxID=189291 RepID=A0A8S9Z5T1_9BILA|nr:Bin3-type SAM domain-containing protein [Meloidogyne graminicola]